VKNLTANWKGILLQQKHGAHCGKPQSLGWLKASPDSFVSLPNCVACTKKRSEQTISISNSINYVNTLSDNFLPQSFGTGHTVVGCLAGSCHRTHQWCHYPHSNPAVLRYVLQCTPASEKSGNSSAATKGTSCTIEPCAQDRSSSTSS
jgi:hypothetical protein